MARITPRIIKKEKQVPSVQEFVKVESAVLKAEVEKEPELSEESKEVEEVTAPQEAKAVEVLKEEVTAPQEKKSKQIRK